MNSKIADDDEVRGHYHSHHEIELHQSFYPAIRIYCANTALSIHYHQVGGGVGVIGAGVDAFVGPNDGFDEGSDVHPPGQFEGLQHSKFPLHL